MHYLCWLLCVATSLTSLVDWLKGNDETTHVKRHRSQGGVQMQWLPPRGCTAAEQMNFNSNFIFTYNFVLPTTGLEWCQCCWPVPTVLLIDLVPAVGCHRPGVWYFVGYVIRSAMWKLGGLGGSWFRSGWDVAHILDTRCRPHMAHIPWPNMGHVPNFAVMKYLIKAWTLFQNLSYPRFSLAAV